MTNERRSHRVAGQRTTAGLKWRDRVAVALPTVAEIRALAGRISGSNQRSRCGRPGRLGSEAYWARVQARLLEAARIGRGIRYLSRGELEAVLCRLGLLPTVPRKTRR